MSNSATGPIDPVMWGRILAEVERGAEDRRNLTSALSKLSDGQDGLRLDLMALQQTANSTATLVHEMVSERHGIRLKALEEAVFSADHSGHGDRLEAVELWMANCQRVIGSTKSLVFKAVGLFVGSAALQAFFIKWLVEHWH